MIKKAVCLTILLSTLSVFSVKSSVVPLTNYANDTQNAMYWSLLDANLDIARLSWSDTLGASTQAEKSDIDSFIQANTDGWRWATLQEFQLIHHWFDSDPYANGWSEGQKAGSALFFLLNGTGPAFTEQNGYDFEGYTYWQFGTYVQEQFTSVWMADFAWNNSAVNCATYSLLCASGYFTDENSPLWSAQDVIGNPLINVAPLLVRDRGALSTPGATITVPATASSWLLFSGLALLALKRRRRVTR